MKNENAECRNTHADKAENYDLGRPEYPKAFFEYIYGEFGLAKNAVIADIGAGSGKITQGFLSRGSRVFAVEPDEGMRHILQSRLGAYPDCTILESSAEDTGIRAGSVDLIFCGNSYYWFDRTKTVPEFKRILKTSNGANIALVWLGGASRESETLHEALRHLNKAHSEKHNESPPFREGAFALKEFEFTLYQDWETLRNGMLSTSFSPKPGEDSFKEYCKIIKNHFEKYSANEKIATAFKLTCMLGNMNDLN